MFQLLSNYILMRDFMKIMGISRTSSPQKNFAELVKIVYEGEINSSSAQGVGRNVQNWW